MWNKHPANWRVFCLGCGIVSPPCHALGVTLAAQGAVRFIVRCFIIITTPAGCATPPRGEQLAYINCGGFMGGGRRQFLRSFLPQDRGRLYQKT